MQNLSYTLGNWRANAQVQEIKRGTLMAIISVTDKQGGARGQSRHTAVFEHEEGRDRAEETRQLVQRLLRTRDGA